MKPIQLSAQFEKTRIRPGGGSIRYLVVEVAAPERTRRRTERPDLNLALVVDRSGSMGGARLEAAKRAAEGVVHGLRDGDHLSLIAFDHDSRILLSGFATSGAGREKAHAAIAALDPGGMTNLAQGGFDGARCVAEDQGARPGAMNRIVVLSDGHANQGIVDPGELGTHARRLAEAAVLTSAVGIGDGYSAQQLQAFADHGGGRLHDAGTPEEMIEVVLMELGEVVNTAAERVLARLECPAGGELEFSTEVSWAVPGSPADRQGAFATARLVFAAEQARRVQPVDKKRAQIAADMWKAALTERAVDFNRAGDIQGSVRTFDLERDRYAQLCADANHGDQLLAEFGELRAMNASPLQTRTSNDLRDIALSHGRAKRASYQALERRRNDPALRKLIDEQARREAEAEADADAQEDQGT